MNEKDYIFFDHNATTPLRAGVWEAMGAVAQAPLNASSVHGVGRAAKKVLADARAKIAKAFGAEGATIIFTSTGTEANNTALRGVKGVQVVVVSEVEHASTAKPASFLNNVLLPVDGNGLVRIDKLQEVCAALKEAGRKFLVSIIHANNESGVIQNVKALSEIIFAHGGFFHIDASQSAGKIEFDFNNLGCDMATISAHKFGGPKGAAALIVKSGLEIEPLIYGGGQEKSLRAGTENLAAIVGFAEAAEQAVSQLKDESSKVKGIRDLIEAGIKNISSEAVIFGQSVERLPNTSLISMPGMGSETQLINFDLEKIAVSAGAACSSGRIVTSHVLVAMQVPQDIAQCAIRVSLGWNNTLKEAERFLYVWGRNYERVKEKLAA